MDKEIKECCPHNKEESKQNYQPLIVIFLYCLLLSFCSSLKQSHFFEGFMYGFMGYFFILLSLFKFFDLKGFVEGFATYDLLTKEWRTYGYLYPCIEVLLGVSYLTHIAPTFINILTILVMIVSGIGILKSVVSGNKIQCACLGTALNVPLGTVSLIENFGMALMAAWMLFVGT